MMDEDKLARYLRIGMEIADITPQELSYTTELPIRTIYNCRLKHNRQRCSRGVWSLVFHALEEWAPGTQSKLAALDRAETEDNT